VTDQTSVKLHGFLNH